ncbi:suppressor of fused domain protein [Kribbella sp. NBC_01245]|uniref:suppressor of fused domain protein n=1 Tax=Kribbella sp. NBC_01245 TaxID=2903578 RepID=UPI002E292904|nr:suppressor of fused domain protein [Kribbella sp. NBC_01245]
MADLEGEAPGWDAIEAAVARVVPAQQPLHWLTNTLPGQDGIYGLSAYLAGGHWLLVTFGLTELFSKESDDLLNSGWGFELTLRVPAAEAEPPVWALRLLQQLGAYVFSAGQPFDHGHRMDPGGPITGAPDTRLTALAFANDPQLATVTTPHGAVRFLTVVGITADELVRMKATSTAEVLTELSFTSPLLVTDPHR